ncbi:MAG: hypothetical protein U1D30_01870 [Planctomycetota bacterium]
MILSAPACKWPHSTRSASRSKFPFIICWGVKFATRRSFPVVDRLAPEDWKLECQAAIEMGYTSHKFKLGRIDLNEQLQP